MPRIWPCTRLLLVLGATLWPMGCIGHSETYRFIVRNERPASVIVQPDQALDVSAWEIWHDTEFGWDVPNGTTVSVFDESCRLLWRDTVNASGFTNTLIFRANGSIGTSLGIALVDDAPSQPIQHSVCL